MRLCAPSAGPIPDQGTRSHMPQLRVCMLQLKAPHATAEGADPCVLQVRPNTAKDINIVLKKQLCFNNFGKLFGGGGHKVSET